MPEDELTASDAETAIGQGPGDAVVDDDARSVDSMLDGDDDEEDSDLDV